MSGWKLEGYDTFDGTYYPLPGAYDDKDGALAAAWAMLDWLEEFQPTSRSGGQGSGGLQDRVYVVSPDGTGYRVFPRGDDGDATG